MSRVMDPFSLYCLFTLSIQAFFKVADKSGDDRISFDEYMEVMLGRRTEQLHE